AKVEDDAATKVSGVRQIVALDDMVAVVGDHMWAAKRGLEALKITWDEGKNANVSSKDIWDQLRAADEGDGVVAKTVGNTAKIPKVGVGYDASYEMPLLAHATMEPLNCTVHVTSSSCDVWVGTQIITRAQSVAAKASGLSEDQVTIHQHLLGGGFGR